jgi:nucleoside-diphosphate-sugar epimerase
LTREKILVVGGGGFIGSHVARHLHSQGSFVRVVDVKFDDYIKEGYSDERLQLDLRIRKNCIAATKGIDKVYNFAANMGGIGFITSVGAEVMHDNVLINTFMLEAARQNNVSRLLFSSYQSAAIFAFGCVFIHPVYIFAMNGRSTFGAACRQQSASWVFSLLELGRR